MLPQFSFRRFDPAIPLPPLSQTDAAPARSLLPAPFLPPSLLCPRFPVGLPDLSGRQCKGPTEWGRPRDQPNNLMIPGRCRRRRRRSTAAPPMQPPTALAAAAARQRQRVFGYWKTCRRHGDSCASGSSAHFTELKQNFFRSSSSLKLRIVRILPLGSLHSMIRIPQFVAKCVFPTFLEAERTAELLI